MAMLLEVVDRDKLHHTDIARMCRTSRSRAFALLNNRVTLFNSETIIDMLHRLGVTVDIVVSQRRGYPRWDFTRPRPQWRPHVYALLALLLGGCAGSPARAPAELHVMVYNIHAGKDAKGADNLQRVADLIRSTGADVALLQEVDVNTQRSGGVDQPRVLAEHTGLHAAFGRTLDYQGGQYGIAILSRWPIVQRQLVPLPIDPPQARAGGSYEPRGALRALLATPFGKLVVLNTHLDASGSDMYRRQEVRTIVALGDSARATARYVIIGGDFNSTPESAVQETMRRSPMRDVWPLCGRGDDLTYPADSAIKRIDYLYLSAALDCEEARVLGVQASDHRPLVVRLRLPPAVPQAR